VEFLGRWNLVDSLYIEWILVESSGIFKYRVDIGGISRLIEFSKVPGLVESSGFPKYRVDISGIFRLVDLNGFFRF